jgi:hypothetical protein
MPRDTMDFVETSPGLSTPTLEGLSYLLRNKELWPDEFVWDYRSCQTCAMGLAAKLWAAPIRQNAYSKKWLQWIVDATGPMGCDVAHDIFIGLYVVIGVERENITPEHVATAIDAYLAGSVDRSKD